MKLKKSFTIAAVCGLSLVAALAFVGCGSNDAASEQASRDDKVIKVGASPAPHADILKAIEPILKKEGYTLEIKEFTDYVQPNVALSSGELDANYFQHLPYLKDYNEKNGTDLVSAGSVHFEPLTIFAGKSQDLTKVADGAKIAVPSDTTNEARALLLLQAEGLLTLKDGAGLEATKQDIVDNPLHLDIIEAEAASLPRTLEDVDFAVINGNYALSAGLDADKALVSESVESKAAKEFSNIIAVRPADAQSEKTKALLAALQSDEVRNFITTTYGKQVVPSFNPAS